MAEDENIISAAARLNANRDFHVVMDWLIQGYSDLVLAADINDLEAMRTTHIQYVTATELRDEVGQLAETKRGR